MEWELRYRSLCYTAVSECLLSVCIYDQYRCQVFSNNFLLFIFLESPLSKCFHVGINHTLRMGVLGWSCRDRHQESATVLNSLAGQALMGRCGIVQRSNLLGLTLLLEVLLYVANLFVFHVYRYLQSFNYLSFRIWDFLIHHQEKSWIYVLFGRNCFFFETIA